MAPVNTILSTGGGLNRHFTPGKPGCFTFPDVLRRSHLMRNSTAFIIDVVKSSSQLNQNFKIPLV